MAKASKTDRNFFKKDIGFYETRKKLGLTLSELAALFDVSRSYMSLVELKQRNLPSRNNLLLQQMQIQFLELEKGIQSNYRSLETRLFLNDLYRQKIPEMKRAEKACREKKKELLIQMEMMKLQAVDAENAIIVFTTAIHKLLEEDPPVHDDSRLLTGLQLFKQKAYQRLLTCWEPEQAKLQAKIEALAGEAKALRRFRTGIVREMKGIKK